MSLNTDKLIKISEDLGFNDFSCKIQEIASRLNNTDCPLILPLVGEFSSGKTTMINALTDSKALETATKPTTATIFEIHFGSGECKAIVTNGDGKTAEIDDVTILKNQDLKDSAVVTVFDTSNKVPSSIVLVDTPGLSSPDPRHRQTLVDFLPQADAVLLVADINAQLTRSLTDFVKTMSLSNRRQYLILTKTDTKSAAEVEASRQYIEDNLHIGKDKIVCISAQEGNFGELLTLFASIQKDKAEILKKVNEQRLRKIATELMARIDELLKVPNNSKDIEESIAQKKIGLRRIQHAINNAVMSATVDIKAVQQEASRKFENTVSESLESLVAGKSNNYDNEAISIINNTASLILSNYKDRVREVLHSNAEKNIGKGGVDMSVLGQIGLDELSMKGLSYNLDLNSLGHQYDGYIANGIKIMAAVAVTGAAIGAATGVSNIGRAVAADSASSAATEVVSTSTIASVADTATDVGSMIMNGRLISRIKKAGEVAQKVGQKYEMIDETESNISNKMHANRGILTTMIGNITDKTMGKPQRRRAIHEYMDTTLMPQFKAQIGDMTTMVVNSVREALNHSAEASVAEMTTVLEKLKNSLEKENDSYHKRMSTLKEYRQEITKM